MPCIKRHYINPKNVFTPNPLNPSPMEEVGCHGLEYMPYPDITLVGLGGDWAWRTAP